MEYAWIGIGSNLLNPKKQVDQAIQALSQLPKTEFISCSKYYRSRPLGYHKQPDFLNTIVILYTDLRPELLLDYMQEIENQQGRVRKFATCCNSYPRTLDLDILLFGQYRICTPKLVIPHYDMMNREFIMYPLAELDQKLVLPNGKCIADIIRGFPKKGLTIWDN
ncbi:7, 8-dihydro-6-hydroxymethylpterin-pyrophosphokinase [Candidatus Blochmanniella floridana]|uniref:2-amino-4-hydroxy-6-hydroxymethyldihydropteridine pyrophosphokinase n=1 Tax=Blochmanniella floridana TaxID=203907 RepID=Q7VQI0_BLOFL|nr:7, 8-dihydro-6-hydroxymethylpterin-pyrophosphokinase [Candidatus Blochmannia floridanus]